MILFMFMILFSSATSDLFSEKDVADVLSQALSSPRMSVDAATASGLVGYAFLAVAGPEGSTAMEPWLLVPRQAWLLEALGWAPGLSHNGQSSWEEMSQRLKEAKDSGWPALWVWEGSDGRCHFGNGAQSPPVEDGCFVILKAQGPRSPWEQQRLAGRAILEVLSYAHAATASGLSGVETIDDPYLAQGFGAYKRLFVDIRTESPPRLFEIGAIVNRWVTRRMMAVRFLRWVAETSPDHKDCVLQAAVHFSSEADESLRPLGDMLMGGDCSESVRQRAGRLIMQALAWHIKGMQLLEPMAFSEAGLTEQEELLLHAPDEEPATSEMVPGLLQLAEHRLAPIRRIAFRKLCGARLPSEGISLAKAALRDADPMVAEAALAVLEAARPAELREILVRALDEAPAERLHGDGSFRRNLVLALTRIREAEVPGLLATIAMRHDTHLCKPRAIPFWCAEDIVALLGQASWPYLKSMLESPNQFSREAGAIFLGRLEAQETMPMLLRLAAGDTSAIVRCAALGAAGGMGSSEALHTLFGHLDSENAEMRVAAVAGLVEAGDQAVQVLSPLIPTANSRVRAAMSAVLVRIDSDQARTLLEQLVESK